MSEGYINSTEGAGRVGGNAKLYIRLLKSFRANTYAADVIEAMNGSDAEKVKSAAHTLKGVCANLALNQLAADMLALENNIKNGESYADKLEAVKASVKATEDAVDAYIAENS